MKFIFGSSPTCVTETHLHTIVAPKEEQQQPDVLSLDEFVAKLPDEIENQKRLGTINGSRDDHLLKTLSQVEIGMEDMERYAHFDTSRNYTRNLISSDYKSYTLLMLCWSPNKASPIHDHPCDGCWMRVIQGNIRERRYRQEEEEEQPSAADDDDGDDDDSRGRRTSSSSSPLRCTHDETYDQGQVVFINDSLGYHSIGSGAEKAVTLHLYIPPFQECRTWLDPNKKACATKMCYYSAYGHVM